MNQEPSHAWPPPPDSLSPAHRAEFASHLGIGRVGTRLVSETDRVRVWALSLAPGERIGFHTHVLDYFWTAVTGGSARSQYADGRVAEVSYQPGDTQHHRFQAGEFMIHDLHNTGTTELVFTTVEFLQSANAPLPIA
jgi:quercetin dioxygenase-like cupin family protein